MKLSKKQKIVCAFGIAILLAAGGGIYYLINPKPEVEVLTAEQQAAKSILDDYEARKAAQQPRQSKAEEFDSYKKQAAEAKDGITKANFLVYAALAGAELKSPEAKAIAAEALSTIPAESLAG